MGQGSAAFAAAIKANELGIKIVTNAELVGIDSGKRSTSITARVNGKEQVFEAQEILFATGRTALYSVIIWTNWSLRYFSMR